jgi:hypothetical protein
VKCKVDVAVKVWPFWKGEAATSRIGSCGGVLIASTLCVSAVCSLQELRAALC